MDPSGESWRTGDARAAGATAWSQRAEPAQRPFRGVRLTKQSDPADPRTRAAAASLVLPSTGALADWAAAAMHGMPATWSDGRSSNGHPLDVPVVIPPPARHRSRAGLRVRQAPLAGDDLVLIDGVLVTSGVRTAFDLIRHASELPRAVAMGDGALRSGLTDPDALLEYALARAGWRGVQLVREAVPLLDRRSESPPESELRVMWRQSGLGIPVPQAKLADELAVFVARVDLLDEAAGVVGEYMGRWHREGARPWRDTTRSRGIRALGLEVVEFWSPDLSSTSRVLDVLRPGYQAAGRRDPRERTYLILR